MSLACRSVPYAAAARLGDTFSIIYVDDKIHSMIPQPFLDDDISMRNRASLLYSIASKTLWNGVFSAL